MASPAGRVLCGLPRTGFPKFVYKGGENLDLKAYLKRIHYHGPLTPTAHTLHQLQVAHLLAVPFENLSIHAEEQIVLSDEALFDKIVRRQRGGFCYELNGLFAAALRELGFKVHMVAARVATAGDDYTPDFDHMALLVELADRWLVDVGFGDTFREPLRLDDQRVQTQAGREYRINAEGTDSVMWERKTDEDWKPQYRFSLRPHQYADYGPRCHFHQTSPDSHFRKNRLCTLATPGGRVTLSGMRLITSTLTGGREEQELANQDEYAQALHDYFGIKI